jgi:Dullard-like phosphatase family protein
VLSSFLKDLRLSTEVIEAYLHQNSEIMLSPSKNTDRKRSKPSSSAAEKQSSTSSSSTPSKLLLSPIHSLKSLLCTPNKENLDVDSNATPSKKQRILQNASTDHQTFISSSPQRPTKQVPKAITPTPVKSTSRNLNLDFASVTPSKDQPNLLHIYRTLDNNNNTETNLVLTRNGHRHLHYEEPGTSTDEECSSSSQEDGRPLKKKHTIFNLLFSPVFHTLFGQKHGKSSADYSEESSSEHELPIKVRPGLVSDETLNELSAYLLPVEPPACTDIYDPYSRQESVPEEDTEEELEEEFDPFFFISTLPPPSKEQLSRPVMLPPKAHHHFSKKTLVLDLDETLVHCSVDPVASPELIFPVFFNGIEYQVYVRKRPHFLEFLKRVSKMFEVVVFTASQEVYASKLLNLLDPNNELIHHRLYRDACVCIDGNYLKDLNILGRDLTSTVIIDNSPQAFGFQLDNGIPIESWFEDPSDTELLKLIPFLEKLAQAEDVRPIVRDQFRLHHRVSAYQQQQQQVTVTTTTAKSLNGESTSTTTTSSSSLCTTTKITEEKGESSSASSCSASSSIAIATNGTTTTCFSVSSSSSSTTTITSSSNGTSTCSSSSGDRSPRASHTTRVNV